MAKKCIGIVPSAKLFKNDDPYADRYEFVNSYIKRIEENNGLALGLLAHDGKINPEVLKCYDAFLITGGLQIHPYHFQVAEYCYKTGKKLLGICLGMQVIHSFFSVLEESKKRNHSGSLLNLYIEMKREKHMFVLPVEGHWKHNITRNNIDPTRHVVQIEQDSHLYQILGEAAPKVSSMHNYAINEMAQTLRLVAKAEDGSPEALEYGKHIIGVQFHPEVDESLDKLFGWLTE